MASVGYKTLMETITWSSAFSVDNEELDSQHREFLVLIREAYAKIGSKPSSEELGLLLDKIDEHANNHFATEEEYFIGRGYEHATEHIKMHDQIRKEISSFKDRHQSNLTEKLVWELVDFLDSWLVDHIIKEDKQYAEFVSEKIKKQQKTPEL